MTELKKLDTKEGRFIANGKTYIIESGFSIQRYAVFQKLQIEAAFGVTFKLLYENTHFAFNCLNAGKIADAAVLLHNIMNGVAKIEQREPELLKMCALFINTADEDRTTISDDQISEKIRDWEAAGYDINDFFQLAIRTISGLVDVWKKLTQGAAELQLILNKFKEIQAKENAEALNVA